MLNSLSLIKMSIMLVSSVGWLNVSSRDEHSRDEHDTRLACLVPSSYVVETSMTLASTLSHPRHRSPTRRAWYSSWLVSSVSELPVLVLRSI